MSRFGRNPMTAPNIYKVIPPLCLILLLATGGLFTQGCGSGNESLSGTYVQENPAVAKFAGGFQYKLEFNSDGTVHMNAMFSDGTDGTYTISGTDLVVQLGSQDVKNFKIEPNAIVEIGGKQHRWTKN